MRSLPNSLCTLPVSVARSSSGTLTISRIAYRWKGGDGSAQRGRSVIYDCLVLCLFCVHACVSVRVRFSVRHVVPPILQLPHSRTTQAFIAVDAASQPSVYGPLLAVFTTFCDTMDYCNSPLCVCVRVHLSNYDLAQRFTIANTLRRQSEFSYCKNSVIISSRRPL